MPREAAALYAFAVPASTGTSLPCGAVGRLDAIVGNTGTPPAAAGSSSSAEESHVRTSGTMTPPADVVPQEYLVLRVAVPGIY